MEEKPAEPFSKHFSRQNRDQAQGGSTDWKFVKIGRFEIGCVAIFTILLLLTFTLIIPLAAYAADEGDTIVLTAQEIRDVKALKIGDVLNNVPGVKAGDSSVSIHGSTKVKVFVDGRPINDPTSSHGGINWDFVSPDDVETIEVLRGKGGLVYGQDAAGGVILITTRTLRRFSGNAKVYGGNYGTRDAAASVNVAAGRFIIGVNGGYESSDGYKINNDKERSQAGVKLSYTPEGNSPVLFSVDYLRDERGSSGLPDYPTPYSRKETRSTVYALQANIIDFASNTHYNDGYRHNTDPSRELDKTLKVYKFGQDITGALNITGKEDLDAGISFTWDRAMGTGFEDQAEHSISLFATQSWTFSRYPLTLSAGLRGNYHSSFDNSLNPEVKVVYKKEKWRVAAAYGRTDNLPSFYQRYNETSSTRPNPDLDMEQAENMSLSLFTIPYPDLSLSFSFFYNKLMDRITYITADDGMGEYHNFGNVRYVGGDVAVSWQLQKTFKIKSSYTYMKAEDRDTGLTLPGKAEHIVDLDIYWQPTTSLSLVAGGKYSSEVYRNRSNTRSVPDYILVDLRAEQSFGRFSVFSEIENLTDETYYWADGLLAPPLTWVLGISIQI
jgi:vitamin B12 transporter